MDKTPPVRPKLWSSSRTDGHLKHKKDQDGGNKSTHSPEKNRNTPSPDQTCSICLGHLQDKSFTDSCFHTFCFVCLQEWSKVKAECPLCKQKFKNIIHNVQSYDVYDTYEIPAPVPASDFGSRRFRYHTTLTLERRFMILNRNSQEHDYTLQRPSHMTTRLSALWQRRRQASTSDFRRRVYTNNLRLAQIPDARLRVRDISPSFFRANEACIHRLVSWLNRELNALLHGHNDQVQFLLDLIIGLIKSYPISSDDFYQHVYPYIGRHTRHFMQEFECFARSPYNMAVYDQRAIYQPQTEDVDNDTDSTNSVISVDDDDVVVVSPNRTLNDNLSRHPIHPPQPPPERRMRDVAFDSITPLLNRVRSYLENDPIHASGWDSPTPGPSWDLGARAGADAETSSPIDVVSEVVDPPGSTWFSTSNIPEPGADRLQTITNDPVSLSSDDSSHESDVMITEIEKPWVERSPILLSSDSDRKTKRHSKKTSKKHHKRDHSVSSRSRSKNLSPPSQHNRSKSRTRSHDKEGDRKKKRRKSSHSRPKSYVSLPAAQYNRDDSDTDGGYDFYSRYASGYRSKYRDEASLSSGSWRYPHHKYEGSRKRHIETDSDSSIEVVSVSKKRKSKHKKKDKHKKKKSKKHRRHHSKSSKRHSNKSDSSRDKCNSEEKIQESVEWSESEQNEVKLKSPLESILLDIKDEKLALTSCDKVEDFSPESTCSSTDPAMCSPASCTTDANGSLSKMDASACDRKADTDDKNMENSGTLNDTEAGSSFDLSHESDEGEGKKVYKKHPTGHKKTSKNRQLDSSEGESTHTSSACNSVTQPIIQKALKSGVASLDTPCDRIIEESCDLKKSTKLCDFETLVSSSENIVDSIETGLEEKSTNNIPQMNTADEVPGSSSTQDSLQTKSVLVHDKNQIKITIKPLASSPETETFSCSSGEETRGEVPELEEEEDEEGEEEEEEDDRGQPIFVCLHNNSTQCVMDQLRNMPVADAPAYGGSETRTSVVCPIDDHVDSSEDLCLDGDIDVGVHLPQPPVINCLELKDDLSASSTDESELSI